MMQSHIFDDLIYWINERESIRKKKEAGAYKPWTNDEILQKYRFCNVNREDDKETRWIKANIRDPYYEDPKLWFNLAVARLINWGPSLAQIGYIHEYDEQWFIDKCYEIREKDGKLMSAAYIVSTNGVSKPKIEYIADQVLAHAWSLIGTEPAGPATCEQWAKFILQVFGLSNFLTNQIVTDMRYTSFLEYAPDWETFVLAGPGTRRGLNKLYGRQITASPNQRQMNSELMEVRKKLEYELDTQTFEILRDPNNLSNSFCELDKYTRMKYGEAKRLKNRYAGLA